MTVAKLNKRLKTFLPRVNGGLDRAIFLIK